MDHNTNTPPVNPAERKVADIGEARAARASSTCAAGASIEMRYSINLRRRTDIAIGGRSINGCIDLSLYRWTGTHWNMLEPAEANRDYLDWAAGVDPSKVKVSDAKSATDTAAVKLLGEPERDIGQMVAARGDSAIIPTPDGYLRIGKDGTIRVVEAEKNLGMTYCVPARIDSQRIRDGIYTPATVPEQSAFGLFLARFFPDMEVRALLQEACASTLLPICFEKALVLVGSGANGKSTLCHLLRALHPSSAAYRLEQSKSRFGNQDIPGRTLLIASEAPQFIGDEAEQNIKSLVSRDVLSVDRKNRQSITVVPQATLVICANQPLRFTDRSYGSSRKYLHIPFAVRLADNDPARVPDYHKRITDDAHEMSILLDWLLVGAQRLLARGRLPDPPTAVQVLSDELRMETDSVFSWAKNCEVTQTHERLTLKSALYRHYADTVLDEGGKPSGAPEFWRRLKEIIPLHETQRRVDGGKRDRFVDVIAAGVTCIADPFPY